MTRSIRNVLPKLLSVLMLVGMLLIALSIPGAAPVLAQTVVPWTTVGAAGTVDNNDLALYGTDDGTGLMFFADSATGTLNVKYNIVAGSGNMMTARFRDNGNAARVILQLRRYGINTGVTSEPLATLDSNTYSPDSSFRTQGVCFTEAFDFENYAYYINAIITRTATTGEPAIGAIKLGFGNCQG
jgi:hypothetical protein